MHIKNPGFSEQLRIFAHSLCLRSAWRQLGDMNVETAQQNFSSTLYKLSVGFSEFVNEQRTLKEDEIRERWVDA